MGVNKQIGILPVVKPIHPSKFSRDVADAIRALSPTFHTKGVMAKVFEQTGILFNHCVQANQKGETLQLINNACTGSGKTIGMIEYASQLADKGMSSLLVVSEVNTGVDLAEKIAAKVGDKVVGLTYSINADHPKHDLWCSLDELPRVAIVTHSMFLKLSRRPHEYVNTLRLYEGRQRNLVCIDERIDLIMRVNFGTVELDEAIHILHRDNKLKVIAKGLTDLAQFVHMCGEGSHEYTCELQVWLSSFSLALGDSCDQISNGAFNLKSGLRGNEDIPALGKRLVSLFKRVQMVIAGRFVHIREGKNIVCHRQRCLADAFGSTVVLDATSSVNPSYLLRAMNDKNILQIQRIPSRDYSSVIVNLCKSKNVPQSQTKINKVGNTLFVKSHLEAIAGVLEGGDRLLVCTFKNLVPLFKKLSPYDDQVEFIWWGSSDARGSNKYKDFNKAMAVGFFRRPMHHSSETVCAIAPWESYIPVHGSRLADMRHLREMLVIDDQLQFLNRIRTRTAINEKGECLPCDLYLFSGGDVRMEELIISAFEQEMSGVVFHDWNPKKLVDLPNELTKVEKRAYRIAAHLVSQIGKKDKVTLNEVMVDLNISLAKMRTAVSKDMFGELLFEEGIELKNSTKRGSPVDFILP